MKRRSFLKAAAAVFPAPGLAAFALGRNSQAPGEEGIHPVGAGEDRFRESHSRGYSTILFKVTPRETSGGLFVIEHANLVKGGPPLHYHPHQEEWFYVMDGAVLFQIGGTRKTLHSGESVLGPRVFPTHSYRLAKGRAEC